MNLSATAIAVFTRAPVAGATKTRLIPHLGRQGAARAHEQMLALAVHRASEAFAGGVHIYVEGDKNHPVLEVMSAQYLAPVVEQHGADLGERMSNALQSMLERYSQALLIGSDCPVLTPDALRQAAFGLQTSDIVLTPAQDGGYVLVGARAGLDQLGQVFNEISWGSNLVMQQTRQRIAWAGFTHTELPTLWDIDTFDDWQRALAAGLVSAIAKH